MTYGTLSYTDSYYCKYENAFDASNTATYFYEMNIVKNLQDLMTRFGHTANKLAELSGVPQPTISRLLKGDHSDPRTKTIEKLAKVYGLEAWQLRGDRVEQFSGSESGNPNFLNEPEAPDTVYKSKKVPFNDTPSVRFNPDYTIETEDSIVYVEIKQKPGTKKRVERPLSKMTQKVIGVLVHLDGEKDGETMISAVFSLLSNTISMQKRT